VALTISAGYATATSSSRRSGFPKATGAACNVQESLSLQAAQDVGLCQPAWMFDP
jgi:hypothetical protein